MKNSLSTNLKFRFRILLFLLLLLALPLLLFVQQPDLWLIVYGLWLLFFWFMSFGFWFLVYGLWFMIYGSGSMVSGFGFRVSVWGNECLLVTLLQGRQNDVTQRFFPQPLYQRLFPVELQKEKGLGRDFSAAYDSIKCKTEKWILQLSVKLKKLKYNHGWYLETRTTLKKYASQGQILALA